MFFVIHSSRCRKVDIEIQEMCFKHAKGNPVTIARGGNRIRLRAVMPNGGATLVTYDTRVTSKVCGRIVYVHSDNTEVKQKMLLWNYSIIELGGLHSFVRNLHFLGYTEICARRSSFRRLLYKEVGTILPQLL